MSTPNNKSQLSLSQAPALSLIRTEFIQSFLGTVHIPKSKEGGQRESIPA